MVRDNHNYVGEILYGIINSNSNAELRSAVISAMSTINFNSWIFASEKPRSLFGYTTLSSGVPFTWYAKYLAKGYMNVDPVVKHCREHDDILLWDANDGWDSAENQVKTFMLDAYNHGVVSGMAIPFCSPKGLRAMLSIVSDSRLAEMREAYLRHMETCRAVGGAIHSAVERFS